MRTHFTFFVLKTVLHVMSIQIVFYIKFIQWNPLYDKGFNAKWSVCTLSVKGVITVDGCIFQENMCAWVGLFKLQSRCRDSEL